jgi:tungstate transport system ATP-binding protein
VQGNITRPASDLPIVLHNVSVSAGQVKILDHASISFSSGAPTVLIGPNGSGKSTLIRIAMGLIAPTVGRVTWGGLAETNGRRLAMVFQRPVMLRRTVAANVAYALASGGRVVRPIHIRELLRRVGLAALADRPARRLSGGEQQRLALARALSREPEVLFLDEPTANLDPASTRAVEDIVGAVASSGVKIVMATHDLGQARRLAGDVAFLARGRVVEHTPADRFFTGSMTPEATAFLRGDLVI